MKAANLTVKPTPFRVEAGFDGKRFPRLDYVDNGNPPAAMNHGFRKASAPAAGPRP